MSQLLRRKELAYPVFPSHCSHSCLSTRLMREMLNIDARMPDDAMSEDSTEQSASHASTMPTTRTPDRTNASSRNEGIGRRFGKDAASFPVRNVTSNGRKEKEGALGRRRGKQGKSLRILTILSRSLKHIQRTVRILYAHAALTHSHTLFF